MGTGPGRVQGEGEDLGGDLGKIGKGRIWGGGVCFFDLSTTYLDLR